DVVLSGELGGQLRGLPRRRREDQQQSKAEGGARQQRGNREREAVEEPPQPSAPLARQPRQRLRRLDDVRVGVARAVGGPLVVRGHAPSLPSLLLVRTRRGLVRLRRRPAKTFRDAAPNALR